MAEYSTSIGTIRDGAHRPRAVLRPLVKIDTAMLDKVAALAGTAGDRHRARAATAADRLAIRKAREKYAEKQREDQPTLFTYTYGTEIDVSYLCHKPNMPTQDVRVACLGVEGGQDVE